MREQNNKRVWQSPVLVDVMQIGRLTEGNNRNPPTGKYSSDTEFSSFGDTSDTYRGPETT